MAIKGNELDWMTERDLREQLFTAEAQEIAASVLAGKSLRKEAREDKKMMREVTKQLAQQVLAGEISKDDHSDYDNIQQ